MFSLIDRSVSYTKTILDGLLLISIDFGMLVSGAVIMPITENN